MLSLQVYWYTALMALTPQPPNADAFAGMALGATIGECACLLAVRQHELKLLRSTSVASKLHTS
jgi:hypothetical protein